MSLTLALQHGRYDPDEQMEYWGFNGPVLTDIAFSKNVYGCMTLCFNDAASAETVRRQTGWTKGVYEHSVEMLTHEDMIRCLLPDGQTAYFGDYLIEAIPSSF